jgi:hypothetical protein
MESLVDYSFMLTGQKTSSKQKQVQCYHLVAISFSERETLTKKLQEGCQVEANIFIR